MARSLPTNEEIFDLPTYKELFDKRSDVIYIPDNSKVLTQAAQPKQNLIVTSNDLATESGWTRISGDRLNKVVQMGGAFFILMAMLLLLPWYISS